MTIATPTFKTETGTPAQVFSAHSRWVEDGESHNIPTFKFSKSSAKDHTALQRSRLTEHIIHFVLTKREG